MLLEQSNFGKRAVCHLGHVIGFTLLLDRPNALLLRTSALLWCRPFIAETASRKLLSGRIHHPGPAESRTEETGRVVRWVGILISKTAQLVSHCSSKLCFALGTRRLVQIADARKCTYSYFAFPSSSTITMPITRLHLLILTCPFRLLCKGFISLQNLSP